MECKVEVDVSELEFIMAYTLFYNPLKSLSGVKSSSHLAVTSSVCLPHTDSSMYYTPHILTLSIAVYYHLSAGHLLSTACMKYFKM